MHCDFLVGEKFNIHFHFLSDLWCEFTEIAELYSPAFEKYGAEAGWWTPHTSLLLAPHSLALASGFPHIWHKTLILTCAVLPDLSKECQTDDFCASPCSLTFRTRFYCRPPFHRIWTYTPLTRQAQRVHPPGRLEESNLSLLYHRPAVVSHIGTAPMFAV